MTCHLNRFPLQLPHCLPSLLPLSLPLTELLPHSSHRELCKCQWDYITFLFKVLLGPCTHTHFIFTLPKPCSHGNLFALPCTCKMHDCFRTSALVKPESLFPRHSYADSSLSRSHLIPEKVLNLSCSYFILFLALCTLGKGFVHACG